MSKDVEKLELPVLGIGEDGERIFSFSSMLSRRYHKSIAVGNTSEDEYLTRKIGNFRKRLQEHREKESQKQREMGNKFDSYDEYEEWIEGGGIRGDEVSENSEGDEGLSEDTTEWVGRNEEREEVEDTDKGTDTDLLFSEKNIFLSTLQTENQSVKFPKEFLKANLIPWENNIALTKEEVPSVLAALEADWRSLSLADDKSHFPTVRNFEVLGDNWMQEVNWDPEKISQSLTFNGKIVWDLNDKNMRFLLKDDQFSDLLKHSAASIIKPESKAIRKDKNLFKIPEYPENLLYYNTSLGNKLYPEAAERETSSTIKRNIENEVSFHSLTALSLATIPLNLTDQDAYHCRHHLSCFFPDPAANSDTELHISNPERIELTLRSVTGRAATIIKGISDALHTTLITAYFQVKEVAFPEAGGIYPRFLDNRNFSYVDGSSTLSQLMSIERRALIWIILEPLVVLPKSAAILPAPDSKVPVKPPGAFTKRRKLTCMDGHILIFEYMEENPLLRTYPGMGVQLRTYIREGAADEENKDNKTSEKSINKELDQKDEWKIGFRKILSLDDESPFIGNIKKKSSVFCVESKMFRAPACAYNADISYFILIRSASGSYTLRSATGSLLLGQQQPLVKVPHPISSTAKDYEEKRLISYVYRKLSQKTHKSSSSKGDVMENSSTVINIDELVDLFPSLSESIIKARLKDRCQCVPAKGRERCFMLRVGGSLHTEKELQEVISPEYVCAYDSMREYKHKLQKLGVNNLDKLLSTPTDKWKLALQMLPMEKRKIGLYLLSLMQSAPWNQCEGYHTWKSGKGRVAVTGHGDCSSRGLCCSFLKEHRRKQEDKSVIRNPPIITGTNADLRRLSADKAVEALQGLPLKYRENIDFDHLKKMDRWEIISFVRLIATAAVTDGVELNSDLAKFARNPHSTAQIAVGLKRRIEQVFEKQLRFISGRPVELDLYDTANRSKVHFEEAKPAIGVYCVHRTVKLPDGSQFELRLSKDKYYVITWCAKPCYTTRERIIEGKQPLFLHDISQRSQIQKERVRVQKPVYDRFVSASNKAKVVFKKPVAVRARGGRTVAKRKNYEESMEHLRFSTTRQRSVGRRKVRQNLETITIPRNDSTPNK